jgi:putative ABC transport system substrate-binding protein
MRRRDFIKGIAASTATTAWSLTVQAQQLPMPVIGLLGSATASDWTPYVRAFHQGLRDAGYVEGVNVAIEALWANSQYERLPAMAAELVERNVTVIAALSTPAARAAKAATTTIPIVFTTNRDPAPIAPYDPTGRASKWSDDSAVTSRRSPPYPGSQSEDQPGRGRRR